MKRKTASDFDQELLDIYDEYVHGHIDRRGFLNKAAKFATGAATAAVLLETLNPQYAFASQVSESDERIETDRLNYKSPDGHGEMQGYAAWPRGSAEKLPAILVIHENRGLNPYVQDVVRRAGVAGFFAFGPDALFPLGGYPGNDDDGRKLQRELDRDKIIEDFIAAARFLKTHEKSSGKLGCVGFCFGGGMCNILASRIPDVIHAAAPFYGRQIPADQVSRIEAPLLLHFAELDKRVNAGWPAYEEALKAHGKQYIAHTYPGTNHGFHNDTTPRYDEAAAKLAWNRTIEFFNTHLR